MDAMTQLQDVFKQRYREEAEADIVRAQLQKRRRDEAAYQRRLLGHYAKYQGLSTGVGEQLSNIENMDKTIDNKIVGLHKAQKVMLEQTNTLHNQVRSKHGDLAKVKVRATSVTHKEIDSIKRDLGENNKENSRKRKKVRSTKSKINAANKNISQTKTKILGEQNRRQVLSTDENGLNEKHHEQEERGKELAREFRALEAVMQVQEETKNNLQINLETLTNEIDELQRAADTNNNEHYKSLKEEIKKKNLQQRDSVRLKQKLQAESEQAEIDFATLKPDFDKVKASHDQQKAAVTKLSDECANVEKARDEVESTLKEKREKLRELSDNHEAFADENSMPSLEKELKKWKTQTTRHEKKAETYETKLEKVRADLAGLEKTSCTAEMKDDEDDSWNDEHHELKREIDEKATLIAEQEQQAKDVEASLEEKATQCKVALDEVDEMDKTLQEYEASITKREAKIDDTAKDANDKQSALEELEKQAKQIADEAEEEQRRIEGYTDECKQRQQQFDNALKQLQDDHTTHHDTLNAMLEKQNERKEKLAAEFKAQNEAHEARRNEIMEKIREIEKELQRMDDDEM